MRYVPGGADAKPSVINIECEGRDLEVKVRLSYFIFFCLMFGAFVYIANSKAFEGPVLGLLDECAYFMLRNREADRLDAIARSLEVEKITSPNWVSDYGIGSNV